MKVYVVIELPKDDMPKINGVFSRKTDAEKVAYKDRNIWRNVVEMEMDTVL